MSYVRAKFTQRDIASKNGPELLDDPRFLKGVFRSWLVDFSAENKFLMKYTFLKIFLSHKLK